MIFWLFIYEDAHVCKQFCFKAWGHRCQLIRIWSTRRTELSWSLCTGYPLVSIKFPDCLKDGTGHIFSPSYQLLFWRVFQLSQEAVALHGKVGGCSTRQSDLSVQSDNTSHALRVHSNFLLHGAWRTALFSCFPSGTEEALKADDISKHLCFFLASGQSVL